jgi:hypothetical protein
MTDTNTMMEMMEELNIRAGIIADELLEHVNETYDGKEDGSVLAALANLMATIVVHNTDLSHTAALDECIKIFQGMKPLN